MKDTHKQTKKIRMRNVLKKKHEKITTQSMWWRFVIFYNYTWHHRHHHRHWGIKKGRKWPIEDNELTQFCQSFRLILLFPFFFPSLLLFSLSSFLCAFFKERCRMDGYCIYSFQKCMFKSVSIFFYLTAQSAPI